MGDQMVELPVETHIVGSPVEAFTQGVGNYGLSAGKKERRRIAVVVEVNRQKLPHDGENQPAKAIQGARVAFQHDG
jgi:hypothetical protein